jgi:hypothetical protein
METYICVVNVFMYVVLPIAVLKLTLDFFKDVRNMWQKNRKNSTEGKSAERVKKNYHKHSISETPINLQEKSFIFGFEDDSK